MTHEDRGLQEVRFPYELLRRWPDAEADNLFAFDATDRLLIDLAAPTIRSTTPDSVVVIGDRYGALTLAAVSLGATGVRVHQDSFAGQLALAANEETLHGSAKHASAGFADSSLDEAMEGGPKVNEALAALPAMEALLGRREFVNCPLGEELLVGARVVLIQLPKDLAQFEHWIRLVAAYAAEDVRVYAGGRIKHMSKAMNQVLERCFSDVSASLARQKSRVLSASALRLPRPHVPEAFAEDYDGDLDLWVCSAPGAFASGRVDHGSRYLVDFFDQLSHRDDSESLVAVDLGCGTGVLASALVRSQPPGSKTQYHVIATDRSAAAVTSARATLSKNVPDGDWEVRQDNALSQQEDGSLDLIVCNPPFHSDAAVSTELSELLFADAARALKPGGIMLTVFNSHLPHRKSLERLVGPTEQLGRNPKFTVTRSIKR
ncbi:MAG: methyltransferase [Scrofimicrobium sp.]